jgi:hypothetical protein
VPQAAKIKLILVYLEVDTLTRCSAAYRCRWQARCWNIKGDASRKDNDGVTGNGEGNEADKDETAGTVGYTVWDDQKYGTEAKDSTNILDGHPTDGGGEGTTAQKGWLTVNEWLPERASSARG